jgi:Carboxypeptidase regulatory-like domain/TonB dependent receptor-like, beta-barrel
MNVRTQFLRLLFALSLSAGMAFGQATNSADITGTVTDPTGAVIPGVTVTVKDIDKGTQRVITSNGAGLYDSGPLVALDHYTLTFSRQGFGTLVRGPMVLQVGTVGMNVQMSVGQATQQVVVNQSAPLLETTSAELSTTLPSQTLQDLPQTGTPDWQSFVVLQPGVSGNAGSAANPGMGSAAANGSLPFSTALLDGSTISSPMSDNVINTPIFDAIGEVKMSDSDFSAQYGTGGVVYNQISKGGTNSWHGEGYDYLENTDLDAASYGFGAGTVPVTHINNFGWQASGPVIKNKIFFFIDWEHRINHGAGSIAFATLPTNNMREGDFTGLATIYDPTTQTVDPSTGTVIRQSFASEYGNGNKIPAGMIDPVAKNIQAIFPSLSATTFSANDYRYANPASVSTEQKWFGRFDADLTSKNHLDGSSAYNYPTTFVATGIVYPVNVTVVDVENESGQLSDVHTFSSTTINEARAGWMGEYDLLTSPTLGKGWPAKLGLQFSHADIYPTINISGYYGLGPGTHANYRENVFNESDVVTMIRGRHTLHFGGELVAYRADSTAWGNINSATLGFTGVYTQEGNTASTEVGGDPYADFLLGYTQNWSASVSPTYYGRLKNPAVFIQDDWKFTPKLTLNLGLRWEGRTGWSDVTKNERSFDPTITNPATNAGGAMWYGSTHVNGRTQLQKNQWNNWLPRFGFAYMLGNKMTLHGGFGIYTFPWNVDNYASCCLGNAHSSSGSESDSTGNVDPVVLLSSDGNTNYQGAAGASINALYKNAPNTPDAYNGQAVSYMKYDQPIPRLYNWNLTVQRQLTGNTMAQVAYVGSYENNLLFNNDIDQVPASELGPSDTTTGCNGGSCRPYPEYQAISGFSTQATSFYSALQAVFERRYSNGLMFNFNYTWSHMTDDQDSSGWGSEQGTTIWQNAYVPSANHGAANFDVRNMFKAYGSYELPFGRGRRFLNSNKVLNEGIGGWTMSLTWIGQGGNPFTPFMLVNNSYASTNQAGGFEWYPNQVGDPKAGNFKNLNGWFDVNAYASPTPGTLGDMRRNSIYGPGLYAMNGSLHKTFPIWERVSFDLAANATNLLNHPSFSNPDATIGPGHSAQITGTREGGRVVELVGKLRF